jgi:hypothetical protein
VFSGKPVKITYTPELPLAMYKELATHLSQLDGVSTELIWQDRQDFSYDASQIAGMHVTCSSQMLERLQELVSSILDRYGAWQIQ